MFNEYQKKAARTSGIAKSSLTPEQEKRLSMACMGLAGETGEVVDLLKKVLFHGKELDLDKLTSELGDVLWYIADICTNLKIQMEDVANQNIQKLEIRYPSGFSATDSETRRDLLVEKTQQKTNRLDVPA